MIFFIIPFVVVPARYSPGKWPVSPLVGSSVSPVPLVEQAQAYSVPSGLVQTSFLTNVRHEWLFAIGKRLLSPSANIIALCALLPSDQPTTVDWPSDKLTNLNHPFMNWCSPCKVSASQRLRPPVHSATVPVNQANISNHLHPSDLTAVQSSVCRFLVLVWDKCQRCAWMPPSFTGSP